MLKAISFALLHFLNCFIALKWIFKIKGSNMKVQIVVTTWICWSIAFGWASMFPLTASYNTVSFGTKDVSVGFYQSFMQSLRRELSSGTLSHDIPVLRTKSAAVGDKQFVYVRLYNPSDAITFAIHALNSYVVAYQVDAERRCYFFKEAPNSTLLFNQCTKKVCVNLETNYANLGKREDFGLGFKQLDESLKVFKNFDSSNPTNELRHKLLVVIQMVAEAARFKYIQLQLEQKGFDSRFFPKGDIISYENNWDALSRAIQQSQNGKFPTEIQLQNEDYTVRKVSTVAEVKNDMGLLLNAAKAMSKLESFEQRTATNGDLIREY